MISFFIQRGSLSSNKTVSWGIKLHSILIIVWLKIETILSTSTLKNPFSQSNEFIARLIRSIFVFWSCQISLSVSKLNFAKLGCKDGWIPDSFNKLGWELKIKSIHEKDLFKICVCSLISWCKPFCKDLQ